MIRDARDDDAQAMCDVYNHYIEHTIISFEEELLSAEDMRARVRRVTANLPWLVFEEGGTILGYAYAGEWNSRCAYRSSVESTIYLADSAAGRGIGTQLYEALIARLRELSIHCVIGGIALPNAASQALHEKLGFEKVAHYREVGWKHGRWIDVGYWQLILSSDEPVDESGAAHPAAG